MSLEPNFSTRDLRAILALSQTRNFGQAAVRMHLSQSALSALIARVEKQLGAKLFERSTRAVELTDAGQVFLLYAQDLLRDTQLAWQAVSDVVQLHSGTVTVAALPSLAASVVPTLFAEYAKQYPAVRLSLLDTLSGEAFDLVRQGKVDFALTAANPQQEDLRYTQLATDQFVLLCPEGHPLTASSAPILLEDTLHYPHVSMGSGASVRQYLDVYLWGKGHKFTPAYELDHIATIGALVSAGQGISALPGAAVSLLRDPRLQQLPLALDIERPLGVVARRHFPLSSAAQAMYQMLVGHTEMYFSRSFSPSA